MKIAVIGLGYIGLPTACLLAKLGVSVVGLDIDFNKVETLNQGILPFQEKHLDTLFQQIKKNFKATTNILDLKDADAIIICVPTPMNDRKMEMKFIDLAVQNIIKVMDTSRKRLIVLESTSTPGTTQKIANLIMASTGLVSGKDFYVAYCPERAIPGNTIHEIQFNDRVIGGINKESTDRALALYSTFVNGNIYLTDATTAEMVKLCENTYRDINISIANEFSEIAEHLGVNVYDVIFLANKHPRVHILQPNIGVGGHCLPLVPWFLTEVYPKARLITTAREINDGILDKVLELIKKENAKKIAILGIAYKPNVSDVRESAGIRLAEISKLQGYNFKKIDPHVYPNQNIYEELTGVDLIVICTNHDIFKSLDWDLIKNKVSVPKIYDGVHLFEKPPVGYTYWCLGRGDLDENY